MIILSKLVLNPCKPWHPVLYDSHRALWQLFGDHADRKRDFLYREIAPLSYLCLSQRPPKDNKGIWSIISKPFAPKLDHGNRLLFSLRVNAVRKTRDEKGRQLRHDIVQHARTRLQAKGVPPEDIPPRPILAQTEGKAWFLNRQESFGLNLEEETFMIEGSSRHTFYKKNSGKGQLNFLDMRGFARVTDADRLMQTIKKGIGPAKGFGCGLLLIQRG